MRKTILLKIILLLSLSVSSANFIDTIWNRYEASINRLQDMKIISWYPGNLYKPDQWISRAEIVTILIRAANIPLITWSKDCFPDVKSWDRFAEYVCTAKQSWIIVWYKDGTFRPYQTVSLIEWLKIGIESFKIVTTQADNEPWYQRYISFAHHNNIFSQYDFFPESAMTRGMMAHLTASIINQGTTPWSFLRTNNSAGCTKSQPLTTPTSIEVNWAQRSIITDLGKNYNQTQPTKLVIAFHGRTNPNTLVRTYYKVDKASDGNIIMVYPSWLPEAWPTRSRQNPWDKPDSLRDYAFFDRIVEEFSEQYCINKDEIYIVWHSLWAWFTNTLACARGNVIRAIGSVGGSITAKTTCTWPTSAIIMHHPDDNLASFAGGEAARDALLKQNQCDISKTKSTWPEWGNCIAYTSCISWSEVIRCAHSDSIENGRYYPHTRPDFAGKAIRDFFSSWL